MKSGYGQQMSDSGGAEVFQLLLAQLNVNRQGLEVFEVFIVELVQQHDIVEQGDLVGIERLHDGVRVGGGVVEAGLEQLDLVDLFLERAKI